MIIVMKNSATQEYIGQFSEWLTGRYDVQVNPIYGTGTTVLALLGDTHALDQDAILRDPHVERITKIQEPFKLANRKTHQEDTVVEIAPGVEVGGNRIVVMAGPCSVESEEQIIEVAERVKQQGAAVLRGGAWKPRSSPYSFQGLKAEGLELLHKAKLKTGLPVVTEITNPAHIELFMDKCDCFQVGARNMQNFELLKELGQLKKPVLLKRGLSNTYEEWIMSAEYIMAAGNENVILCERGVRTFETYTRNTLDLSAIPAIRKMSHLPIVVDPSHAAGMYWMVEPLAMAAVAVGADGLMVEVHNDPPHAKCDGAQSLTPEKFRHLMGKLNPLIELMGKALA